MIEKLVGPPGLEPETSTVSRFPHHSPHAESTACAPRRRRNEDQLGPDWDQNDGCLVCGALPINESECIKNGIVSSMAAKGLCSECCSDLWNAIFGVLSRRR